jgi:hypothetical protein
VEDQGGVGAGELGEFLGGEFADFNVGHRVVENNGLLIQYYLRMDSYPQLILLFYRKATARHSRKMLLIRKLHALLQAVAHMLSLQPQDCPSPTPH